MFSSLDKTSYIALFLNVFLAIGFGLLIDLIVFSLLIVDAQEISDSVSFAPSGEFVGTVWVILFGLMGAARWCLNRFGAAARNAKWWIVGLLFFCFIYPFYTLGLSNEIIGLIGNIATIGLTVFVISRVWKFSKQSAFLLAPIILWLTFASFIILAELKII